MIITWCHAVVQYCATLCNPVDCSLPGSSVHGILQARVLEWVAISFSAAAKSLQLCPTLCDPSDYNPPGSSVHRILQARIPEWVAMPFSRGRDWTHISYIVCRLSRFFTTISSGKPLYGAMWLSRFSHVWLCDPIDSSTPGSPILGILQARTLEWVAISVSNAWKWKVKMKVKPLSHIRLLVTPRTAAYQAPLSMGLSRQEYWSGVPLPSPIWCHIMI